MTPTTQGGASSRTIWAGLLMAVGVALAVVAVVRLVSDDSEESAGDQQPCVTQPCRANNDPRPVRGYEVPSVAVDPAQPGHIVITDVNLVGGECGWHVTFNGGRDWQDGVLERPPGFRNCRLDSGGFLPMGNVAIGPSGTVYAVLSLGSSPGGGRPIEGESVLLAVSTDGGRTFGPTRVVLRSGGPLAFLRPQLTVAQGPGGRDQLLLSFWGCERNRCNRAFFARSTDAGQTFSAPVPLDPVGANSPSQPVLGPDGTIYVMYLHRLQGQDSELVLARSNNGGATFSAAVVNRHPDIGLQYDSPKLVVGPDRGALYTVYSHRGAGESQVVFSSSEDGGAKWSEPKRLNRSAGTYFGPTVSVAPNGRLDVAFYQGKAPPSGATSGVPSTNVLWTSSTDGGATFAPDRRLNFPDRDIDRMIGYWLRVGNFYPPAVASLADGAIYVWSDTRLGTKDTDTQDIFLRRMDRGI